MTTSFANQTIPQRLTVASVAYLRVSTSNMIRTFLRWSADAKTSRDATTNHNTQVRDPPTPCPPLLATSPPPSF